MDKHYKNSYKYVSKNKARVKPKPQETTSTKQIMYESLRVLDHYPKCYIRRGQCEPSELIQILKFKAKVYPALRGITKKRRYLKHTD